MVLSPHLHVFLPVKQGVGGVMCRASEVFMLLLDVFFADARRVLCFMQAPPRTGCGALKMGPNVFPRIGPSQGLGG